ncbi:hypothetical protein AB4166_21255 [Vibrio splendidus]
MNILFLEDQKKWLNTVLPELNNIPHVVIHHVENHDDAISLLEGQEIYIDFALLDLAVPLNSNNPTPDLEHGLALAWYIRNNFPGIPITFLTGQSTEEAVEKFEEENTFTIFWDGQEKPLVRVKQKRQIVKVLDEIKSIAELLFDIDEIEVECGRSLKLHLHELRILKLFCKHKNGTAVEVKQIGEGLSSSKVLNVTLLNSSGNPIHYALAKIDKKKTAEIERDNFNSHIVQLNVGSFPAYINEYYAGCGSKKGVFFQFASDYKLDFFDTLLTSDDDSYNVATKTKRIFQNWIQNKASRKVSICDVRRSLCSDIKFEKVTKYLLDNGISLDGFENNTMNVNYSVQHADLHGMNILISDLKEPLIIDYGDVKSCPSTVDSVTLELSHFFHPKMKGKFTPSKDLAQYWFDEEKYLEHTTNPKTAKFLRNWSNENKYLSKEYAAVVYAYSIRQLTYPDTNKEFATELIRSAIAEFD